MTRSELLKYLTDLAVSTDTEAAHAEADARLLMYLDDAEITEAYDAIAKWYA